MVSYMLIFQIWPHFDSWGKNCDAYVIHVYNILYDLQWPPVTFKDFNAISYVGQGYHMSIPTKHRISGRIFKCDLFFTFNDLWWPLIKFRVLCGSEMSYKNSCRKLCSWAFFKFDLFLTSTDLWWNLCFVVKIT